MSYPAISRAIEGYLLFQAASGRSPNTIRNYRMELKRFSDWAYDIPVNQVDSKRLETYMLYLRNEFKITHVATTSIKPRNISQKTLSNAHGSLAVFWKWVSKEFGIPNPFKVSPIKSYTKPISPLQEEEISSLLGACRQTHKEPNGMKPYDSTRQTFKRDRAIILTLLDTGMRVSELCGIEIKDMDLDRGRILITGKGNKSRFVFLGKVCRQAVWTYLAERFPNQKPQSDEPLFTNHDGIHRLTRQGILLLLKRIGKRAGVLNIHPHKFRHTFAVEFLKNGGNVFELQQILGHSDLDMSRKYVQLAQVDLESSARRASPADRWRLRP